MEPIPVPPDTMPVIPLEDILTAVSDMTRWRILDELLKGEPLPAQELSTRLGVPATNISKHCLTLLRFGIVQRGYGNLYKITPAHLIPGQRAIDLGAVVLRLDRLDAK
jgi:DNA-binding IclR family transcriptional regulator